MSTYFLSKMNSGALAKANFSAQRTTSTVTSRRFSAMSKAAIGVVCGALLFSLMVRPSTVLASEALIEQVEVLRDTSASSDKAQIRALTVKLANMHFSEAVNLNSSPDQTRDTPRKVLTHRLRAIQLFEGFLSGEKGRYEAPTGEQRAAVMFNLARVYADTQKNDKAELIWKELSKNKDYPSIASESSLNLAEISEAANAASKEALEYFRIVIALDKRQDLRNYAHYRAAWIERNLEQWSDAIADLKEALYDGKGQIKEEVVSDLVTFHAMSGIQAEVALAYFYDLAAKSGRPELPGRLADAYLASGKKTQAVSVLKSVTTTKSNLLHSMRLLEEAYGLRDWVSYTKAVDQIEHAKLDSVNKEQQADVFKILKRLMVQLDAERQTRPEYLTHFVAAAEVFVRFFPADEDIFKVVSNLIFVETDDASKARRIREFLDSKDLKISVKNQLVMREQLVSIYQKLGKHDDAAMMAQSIVATATGPDVRRFTFVQASELNDAGKEKEALALFQGIVAQNREDDFGLKSQMVVTKLLGKSGDYKGVLASTDSYLKAVSGQPSLKTTKEYQAIIEVRDRSEFENAVTLGATPGALASFQKFCTSGQFAPKACENASSVAVKIGDYDALLAILRFEKKNAEVTQILESSARFEDAAKDLEAKLTAKTSSMTDYLHVAILFEIAGNSTERNRILGNLVTFIGAKSFGSFGSVDEESLIFRTLDETSQLKGKALALKWSDGHRCELLNRAVAAGDTSKKTVDTLLSCKTFPGAAWTQQAMARVQTLHEAQAKLGFYGNNSKNRFQKRLAAISVLAKEIDRLMPSADSASYTAFATRAQDSYLALAKEIEAAPIPAEVTEDMLPQVRQALADMASPIKQKAEAYAGFIAKETASNKDKGSNNTAQVTQAPEPVAPSETAASFAILRKDPSNREALAKIREAFSQKGNMRVAAYFDGRIKQTEVRQ
jgi:tetratricopeptide (TPR) repeat protein